MYHIQEPRGGGGGGERGGMFESSCACLRHRGCQFDEGVMIIAIMIVMSWYYCG